MYSLLPQDIHYYVAQLKAFYVYKLIAGVIVAALTPQKEIIAAFAIVYFIDVALGVARAVYHNRIQSAGLGKGIIKFVLYMIALLVISILEYVAGTGKVLMSCAVGFIVANEALSILEHLDSFGIRVTGVKLIREMLQKKYNLKTSIYHLDDNAGDIEAMYEILEKIKDIKNDNLRGITEIYFQECIEWVKSIQPHAFDGPHPTVVFNGIWNQYSEVFKHAQIKAVKRKIKRIYIHRFYDKWTRKKTTRLGTHIRVVCDPASVKRVDGQVPWESDCLSPISKLRALRSFVLVHLYAIRDAAVEMDRSITQRHLSDSAIESSGTHTVVASSADSDSGLRAALSKPIKEDSDCLPQAKVKDPSFYVVGDKAYHMSPDLPPLPALDPQGSALLPAQPVEENTETDYLPSIDTSTHHKKPGSDTAAAQLAPDNESTVDPTKPPTRDIIAKKNTTRCINRLKSGEHPAVPPQPPT